MVKSIGGSRQIPNMHGKRYMPLRCRCCVLTDLRPKFTTIEHRKEMDDAMSERANVEAWGGLG